MLQVMFVAVAAYQEDEIGERGTPSSNLNAADAQDGTALLKFQILHVKEDLSKACEWS